MKINCLSSNMLKIFAAICMLCDHVGMLFFPENEVFRIIGRFAFPIFAYMIAEGCRYTKNKEKYFSLMFFPAFICQTIAGLIYPESLYYCILITFSLSVIVIYALQNFKNKLFEKQKNAGSILFSGMLFVLSVASVWLINRFAAIDYGFWGCMVPVFASLLQPTGKTDTSLLKSIDHTIVHVVMLGVGLFFLWKMGGGVPGVQEFSFGALLPMLFYSGKRGKMKLKYFFYIFYPTHLLLLGIIYLLV